MQSCFKFLRSSLFLVAAGCMGIGLAHAAETAQNSKSEAEKPKVAQFCWTELATTNVQAAKDFYAKVFGWKFKEESVGDMTYTMVNINDKEFAGIWAIPKDQQKQIPPHWLAYILVENLEQSLEKATKNGATIVRPVTQVAEHGRLAIIKDPTGAQVALWQNLKPNS